MKKPEKLLRPWNMKVEVNAPKLGKIFSPHKLSAESETWSTGQEQCHSAAGRINNTCCLVQFNSILCSFIPNYDS